VPRGPRIMQMTPHNAIPRSALHCACQSGEIQEALYYALIVGYPVKATCVDALMR